MTFFDYGVIAIVGASLLLGLWRGVVGELIALAAWILAFFAAREFGPQLGQALFTGITDPAIRTLAGCAAVFIGVLILMSLGRLAASSMIRALGLGLSDRLLGLFFGLLRGLLIVLILVAVGGMTAAPRQNWWLQAQLSPPLETAVLAARPWLPDDVAKRIKFR
ncbi:CvpA family protein [Azovibrio restrictus]|uniref:CvpA family protein n=1 Tax=Azovibrio restrictus TaxID=146938 RepID=UPI0026EB1F48|nr:CvpA family protein [Azovibrio restrictus]MDD3481363.1 CvpA family protein [Azovibrio restrictus]